ncbi:magnesium chelatase subunit D [Rhodoblastus acidophilus]|uniref:Magnesium chelatase subunit D n=1 Tax=Rhodoblastus acidophilus TaxID=1074 RepID=A0A6N8DLA6_RHOAC|nr:magnesium chelatase subunit D [Rhodoblastus acidophilus]MCW2273072.1 magnesium chelatase subunit D [Rhodoblastus acidophilus]MTV29971.1 magnesium chelatase subunit D [Rhodoblastus acidophilus]
MSVSDAVSTPWRRASLAAAVFAVDPLGSGLLVRAGAGPARDELMTRVAGALAPMRLSRAPADIADDRLIGGLDVAATLRAGKPIAETGVLAASHGGVLAIVMAERISAGVAARLSQALDMGEVALQRDGLSAILPAHVGIIALDEGQDDEATPAALAERLGFWIDLEHIGWRDIEPPALTPEDFEAARKLLPSVETDDQVIEILVATAAQFGVDSPRAVLFALRAARAFTALRGETKVERDDIELAATLVLGPRATRMPAPPEEQDSDEPPPPPPEETPPDEPPEQKGEDNTPRELEEQILEAVRAALPPGLLAALAAGAPRNRRSSAKDGKSGEEIYSLQRGRPLDARPGSLSKGRLALVATLRAAAPWRKLRLKPEEMDSRRVIVKPEDFRIRRHRQKKGATTIFVVDASGSLAMTRLAEVKGAIEMLLADCYARRDNIALVAFRGRAGEIVLPPTRSTARAKRALTGLPGGGGTPVAAGLDVAAAVADQARRKGQTPLIVLMTDGRANICRDGGSGRPRAMEDALDAAKRIAAAQFSVLAIDTTQGGGSGPDAPVRVLAGAMQGRYVKLPRADAAVINAVVRGALPQ